MDSTKNSKENLYCLAKTWHTTHPLLQQIIIDVNLMRNM